MSNFMSNIRKKLNKEAKQDSVQDIHVRNEIPIAEDEIHVTADLLIKKFNEAISGSISDEMKVKNVSNLYDAIRYQCDMDVYWSNTGVDKMQTMGCFVEKLSIPDNADAFNAKSVRINKAAWDDFIETSQESADRISRVDAELGIEGMDKDISMSVDAFEK